MDTYAQVEYKRKINKYHREHATRPSVLDYICATSKKQINALKKREQKKVDFILYGDISPMSNVSTVSAASSSHFEFSSCEEDSLDRLCREKESQEPCCSKHDTLSESGDCPPSKYFKRQILKRAIRFFKRKKKIKEEIAEIRKAEAERRNEPFSKKVREYFKFKKKESNESRVKSICEAAGMPYQEEFYPRPILPQNTIRLFIPCWGMCFRDNKVIPESHSVEMYTIENTIDGLKNLEKIEKLSAEENDEDDLIEASETTSESESASSIDSDSDLNDRRIAYFESKRNDPDNRIKLTLAEAKLFKIKPTYIHYPHKEKEAKDKAKMNRLQRKLSPILISKKLKIRREQFKIRLRSDKPLEEEDSYYSISNSKKNKKKSGATKEVVKSTNVSSVTSPVKTLDTTSTTMHTTCSTTTMVSNTSAHPVTTPTKALVTTSKTMHTTCSTTPLVSNTSAPPVTKPTKALVTTSTTMHTTCSTTALVSNTSASPVTAPTKALVTTSTTMHATCSKTTLVSNTSAPPVTTPTKALVITSKTMHTTCSTTPSVSNTSAPPVTTPTKALVTTTTTTLTTCSTTALVADRLAASVTTPTKTLATAPTRTLIADNLRGDKVQVIKAPLSNGLRTAPGKYMINNFMKSAHKITSEDTHQKECVTLTSYNARNINKAYILITIFHIYYLMFVRFYAYMYLLGLYYRLVSLLFGYRG